MPDFFAALSDASASPTPGVSVVADWCTQINLFESRAATRAWADSCGIRGQTQSLTKAATRGAAQCRPMVPEVR